MTKREAKRIAYRIAYRFVQQAIDGGGHEANYTEKPAEDQLRIDAALDEIAQMLFERSDR